MTAVVFPVLFLDTDPLVPENMELVSLGQSEDRARGVFILDPARIELLRVDATHPITKMRWLGRTIYKIFHPIELTDPFTWRAGEQLKGREVLPSNVLDAYLAAPQLFPDEWKDKRVVFWTWFGHPHRGLAVRYLEWDHKSDSLTDGVIGIYQEWNPDWVVAVKA